MSNDLKSLDGMNRSLTARRRTFAWILGVMLVVMIAVPLLTTACSAGPLQAQPPVTDGEQMWVEFTGPNGEVEAKFFVWPRATPDGLTEILVQFPYIQNVGYRLDTFTLDATAAGSIEPPIMMEATPYAWETMTFRRIDEGVRLQVPDTGKTGDGTIDITLIVPNEFMAERDLVLNASLQTKAGTASGEIRLDQRGSSN